MCAHIISLAERISVKEKQAPDANQDFHSLFKNAHELRSHNSEDLQGTIAVLQKPDLKNWFQQEIADAVFQKKLFSRSILISIWFVSDLLATATGDMRQSEASITDQLHTYEDSGNPEHLLHAANTAFLLFVFWPETRPHRPLKYRKFAFEIGPSLYINYSQTTRKEMGFYMAEAFEPLGTIARERFKLG